MNRPEKLNALNREMLTSLARQLDIAETDDSVRAIVITGAGRAFSAGADIAEFAIAVERGSTAAARDFVRPGQELTRRIESFRKPVIAAVNGLAYGGGCEIMEAMHLAVASNEAVFSKSEINIGVIPVFGGTQRLPRHVGRKIAFEMILTGCTIDAAEAKAAGLVNRVVPRHAVLDEAIKLADLIASKSGPAVSASMLAISRGLNTSIDEGLLIEAAAFEAIVPAKETMAGIRSFLGARRGSASGRE